MEIKRRDRSGLLQGVSLLEIGRSQIPQAEPGIQVAPRGPDRGMILAQVQCLIQLRFRLAPFSEVDVAVCALDQAVRFVEGLELSRDLICATLCISLFRLGERQLCSIRRVGAAAA